MNISDRVVNTFTSIISLGFIFFKKLPYSTLIIDKTKPFLLYLSCSVLHLYGRIEIFYNNLCPIEKDDEYQSLYCYEDSDFINSKNEIKRLLSSTERSKNYVLKFKKENTTGRLYLPPSLVYDSINDIAINKDKMILSAIYKFQSNETIIEKDITDLLNEHLICNSSENFSLYNIVDDNRVHLDKDGEITIINNLADTEIWKTNMKI